MAKEALNYEQKYFIVTRLGRRRTPSEVVAEVLAEFRLTITRQRVEKYDPTKKNWKPLSAKWRDLFYRERVKYEMELEEQARSRT